MSGPNPSERARRPSSPETSLDQLIRATPFIMTRCSRDLRYACVSPAYAEMVGRPRCDIEGQPIVEVMGEEGFATIRPYVEQVLVGEPVEYESDVRIAGVGLRSLRAVYTPDRNEDGLVVGWVASLLDLTDTRAAADARAIVNSLVNSSVDAIVTKDLDGTVVSWNPAAQRLFGYAAEEMIGRSIRLVIPSDRQSEEDDILMRLSLGERIEHFETVRVAKDGRRLQISATISPLRNASGKIVGASKIARDISAMKADEVERLRLVQENAVIAQEANRLKDEFLASLSHELRTPLSTVLGYTRMLHAGLLASDKQTKAIEAIDRNATSLARMVDDLLDISRVVSGKIRLKVQTVDLSAIVAHAIEGIAPAAEAKDVRLEARLPSGAMPISGDPDRLQQVFWNLLSNAVKFTNQGGSVVVQLERVGGSVVVKVSDTGIGIAPEFLPHVFERFRQADTSTARERGGLGLGLSIARQLAEMHQGSIEASSRGVGAGATFTVTLPVARPASIQTDRGAESGGADLD